MGQIVTSNDPIYTDLGISTPTASETAVITSAITRAEAAIKEFIKYDPVQKNRIEYYPNRNLYSNGFDGIYEVDGNSAYLRQPAAALADELQVKHLPIRSITNLWIDYDARAGTRTGAFNSDNIKTEGVDYWANYDFEDSSGNKICTDGVIRGFGIWPTEPGCVKIQYTAGYSQSEFLGQGYILDASAIYEAVVMEASRRAKQAFLQAKGAAGSGSGGSWVAGNIQSERLGDYSYSLGSSVGGSGSTSNTLYGGVNALLPQTKEILQNFVNYGWAFFS